MAEGYAKLIVQVNAVIATIMQNLKQKRSFHLKKAIKT
jgi:hypothetical protein